MKIIIGAIITLSLAANSLIAWQGYYPGDYGTYGGYSYPGSWKYPSSYDEPRYQDFQQAPPPQTGITKRPPQEQIPGPQPQEQIQAPEPQTQSDKALEQQYPNLIVMFTKNQCPYCVYMKPIMQQVEMKYGKDIKFAYVDIVKNPETISQYGFSTVPHIVYFKDGKQLDAHGSDNKTMTAEQVEEKIKRIFGQ